MLNKFKAGNRPKVMLSFPAAAAVPEVAAAAT